MDATQPNAHERIDAIEQFLQQLVLLLEVEPELSRDSIGAWFAVCQASSRASGVGSARSEQALTQLCGRVLESPVDMLRPSGTWPS